MQDDVIGERVAHDVDKECGHGDLQGSFRAQPHHTSNDQGHHHEDTHGPDVDPPPLVESKCHQKGCRSCRNEGKPRPQGPIERQRHGDDRTHRGRDGTGEVKEDSGCPGSAGSQGRDSDQPDRGPGPSQGPQEPLA